VPNSKKTKRELLDHSGHHHQVVVFGALVVVLLDLGSSCTRRKEIPVETEEASLSQIKTFSLKK